MTLASDTQLFVTVATTPLYPLTLLTDSVVGGRWSDVRGSSGRAKHGRGGAGVHVHVAPGAAPTPALSPEAAPGRPAAVTHPQALRAPQTPRQPGPQGRGQNKHRDGERPGQ